MPKCIGQVLEVGDVEKVATVSTAVSTLRTYKFLAKCDRSGGESACWPWIGHVAGKGYGYFRDGGKDRRAHRVAYEMFVGPIPDGLVIDHLCRNRLCVNPAHLEAVTNRENVLRGGQPEMVAARTNMCKRGHSLADAYVNRRGRHCRVCRNERAAAQKRAARAARKAVSA